MNFGGLGARFGTLGAGLGTGGGSQPVVAPPPAPTSYAATSGALSASTTTTLAITVPAASNRKLVVPVALPVGANAGTIASVSLDGVPLAIFDTRDLADGARRNYVTHWFLDNPKVGAGTLTITRTPAVGFEATTVRVIAQAFTSINSAPGAPSVLGFIAQANDQTTYSNTAIAAVDDTAVYTTTSTDLTSGSSTTPAMVLQPGGILVGSAQPAAASPYASSVLGRYETPASETVSLNLSGASPTARNAIMVAYGIVGVAAVDYVPIYFVANEGNDANDGLSEATAVKSITSLAGVPASSQITLKAGQRHRPVSYASARILLDLLNGGTSSAAMKIASFGAGARPIIDGSVLEPGWSAVSSGEVFSNANSASIVKMTSPPTLHRNQFPNAGDARLYPAQWPAPTSNSGVDKSYVGSGSFNFYDAATFAARVSTTGSGPYTHTITDPAIAARYGANSPKGFVAAVRMSPNVTREAIITAYNQGTSSITFTTPNVLQTPTANAPFYFAIRFHPLDIVRAGQYAWLLNGSDVLTNLAAWFPAGERSLTHCSAGVKADTDYITIDGVDFARFAGNPADDPNSRASAVMQAQSGAIANNLILKNSHISQTYDPERSGAIAAHGASPSTGWTMQNVTFSELLTQSGFRLNSIRSSKVEGASVRGAGRTSLYFAETGMTGRDVDMSENISVHGNGITTYVNARGCLIENWAAMGNSNPITSQVDSYTSGDVKANIWRSGIGTGMRRPDGGSDTAWVGRFDGGDVNTLIEKAILFGGASGGMVLSGTAGPNTGMILRRGAFQSLGTTSSGLNGITMDRLLLTQTHAGLPDLAAYAAAGATVINCEIDTGQSWNGCPTTKMQKYLTWASGSPGSEVYEAVQIGPASWDWTIPPFGTIGALVDLGLTTTKVAVGHQAGETIGCVIRPRPGSSLSLPVGEGDNALLGLDRGNVYPLANLTSGNKNLVVDETNAGASNGPVRRTIIPITVA